MNKLLPQSPSPEINSALLTTKAEQVQATLPEGLGGVALTSTTEVAPLADSVETTRVSSQYESIRQLRSDDALERSQAALRRRTNNQYIASVGDFDQAVFGSDTLWAMQAYGKDAQRQALTIAYAQRGESAEVPLNDKMSLRFSQEAYPGVLSTRIVWDKDMTPDQKDAATQQLNDTIEAGRKPFVDAMQELSGSIETSTSSTADRIVSFKDQLPEIVEFLGMSRVNLDPVIISRSKQSIPALRERIAEALYAMPLHYADDLATDGTGREGLYFDVNGRLQKVVMRGKTNGLYLSLVSADPQSTEDITDLPLKFGVEYDAAEATQGSDDYGNNSAEAFIDTPTSQELLRTFEQANLQVNERLVRAFAEVNGEDFSLRYGTGYADITREIAKLVNDSRRPLNKIFENENGTDASLADQVRSLSTPEHDHAAAIAIRMLKQSVLRDASPELPELPLSSERIEIKDGSCIDAEHYIASGYTVELENGVTAIKSSYHREGYVNTVPVRFNGVEIPAGALFAKGADGYILQRITGYAFTPDEALQVFGGQELKNRLNSPRYKYRQ